MIRKSALIVCASLLALCLATWAASCTTWGQTALQPASAPALGRSVATFKYAGRDYHLMTGIVDRQLYLTIVVTSPAGSISGMPIAFLHWEKRFLIPLWLVCTLLAAPSLCLVYIRHWRRLRRLRNARCIECGYNLTGNMSGVCPECGSPVPRRGTDRVDEAMRNRTPTDRPSVER